MMVRKSPADKKVVKTKGAAMASRSSRRLGTLKKLAKPAKPTRVARMPTSVGAAAVEHKPRTKPRTKELGSLDQLIIESATELYCNIASLVEAFRRRLKEITSLKRRG